jgi:hypothetical protein
MTAKEIYNEMKGEINDYVKHGDVLYMIAEWIEKNFDHKSDRKENVFSIEYVDRYWYYCGRNNRMFVEVTFWINPVTLERKETSRSESFFQSEEYKMPEWCKSIKDHRSNLDAQYY